jgi:hypothetical protein
VSENEEISNQITREIEEEKRQRAKTRKRQRAEEEECVIVVRREFQNLPIFLNELMSYWVGPYIHKVSIEPGQVPEVAGCWNRP